MTILSLSEPYKQNFQLGGSNLLRKNGTQPSMRCGPEEDSPTVKEDSLSLTGCVISLNWNSLIDEVLMFQNYMIDIDNKISGI